MGIAVDTLIIIVLLSSAIGGWRQGFLYQIGYLAALVVSYALARGLSPHLATILGSKFDLAPLATGAISFICIFIALAFISSLLVRKMTREMLPKSSSISQMNHALGAIAGTAKGALLSYIGLVLLLQYVATNDRAALQTSRSLQWVAENQDFIANGRPGALAKLVSVLSAYHDNLPDLAKDPRGARLLAHPKSQALSSPDVVAAVGSQDYVSLLSNEKLWDFLDDSEVRSILSEFPWSEIRSN